MSTQNLEKQVVAPEEFHTFLQGLHLQTLRVRKLKVDAEREFAHSALKNVQHRESHTFEMAEDGPLRIDAKYEVKLVGERRKKLGSIAVTFSWYYHSDKKITDEIFELFAPMVRFQTWPHLREVIQSVAARTNWPRLTMPLLVASTEAPKE